MTMVHFTMGEFDVSLLYDASLRLLRHAVFTLRSHASCLSGEDLVHRLHDPDAHPSTEHVNRIDG